MVKTVSRGALVSFLCLLAGATAISGCGSAGFAPEEKSALIPAGRQGVVRGGQQPVTGATVQLYAVGTSGDGSAATPLLSPAVITDSNGGFDITGLYKCPSASALVYIVATGGNPGLGGSANNGALALMAALGPCGNLTSSTFIFVNELTTVAAVYSLAPYMASAMVVGSGASDQTGLANAFTLASELVNTATGSAPGTNLPSGAIVPTAQLNLIADILAACVNSPGGTAGDGSNCGSLFTLTTPTTTPATMPATNTIAALLNLANNPTLSTAALYALASSTGPFQPTPANAPQDMVVSLTYPAGLTASTSSINFGTLTTGFTSAAQTVTVTNSSAQPVIVSAIALTGSNTTDFLTPPLVAPQTLCEGYPIFPGQTCSVAVQFEPQAVGARSGSLVFTSNAVNPTLTIPLGGQGIAPTTAGPITLSPSSLSFSEFGVPQSATLSNYGNTTLTINRITLPGSYSETDNCGTSLPAQSICTINVALKLSGSAPPPGTMSVVDDATGGSQTVGLSYSGIAIGGGDESFGNWAIGASTTTSVTLGFSADPFNVPVAISGANASDFTIGGSSTGQCVPTQESHFLVCGVNITFSPTALGTRTATLTYQGYGVGTLAGIGEPAGADFSITYRSATLVTSYNFNLGTVPFTITNTGTVPLSLSAPIFTGPNASQFSATNTCATQLALGATCTVTPTYVSTPPGPLSATMSLSDTTQAVTRTMQLTANSYPPPPSGSILNFPTTQVGATSAAQQLTVSAYNNDPVTVSGPVGGYPTQFAIVGGSTTCPQTPCQVPIVFTPSMSGPLDSSILLTDSVYNGSSSVNLIGTGQNGYPAVGLSTGSLTFPLRSVGTTSIAQSVTLTNTGTGTAALTIGGISLAGANPGDYVIETNTCGSSLATGANCSLSVSFSPTTPGTRTADVQILSNASSSPDMVGLSGIAQ